MILTVANQKGGVGKTTFLVNFAHYLREIKDKKTCVIDLDTQANCSHVLDDENTVLPADSLFQEILSDKILSDKILSDKISLFNSSIELLDEEEFEAEIFFKNLDVLKQYYDYILIDTAPVVSNRLILSLQKSNFVITPIELEVFSLQGLELMLNTISNIKDEFNESMVFLGVLPSRVNTTNPRQLLALDKLVREYGKDFFLPYLKNRNDIANALSNKVSIFKTKTKYKKEILNVFDDIYEKIIRSNP